VRVGEDRVGIDAHPQLVLAPLPARRAAVREKETGLQTDGKQHDRPIPREARDVAGQVWTQPCRKTGIQRGCEGAFPAPRIVTGGGRLREGPLGGRNRITGAPAPSQRFQPRL
jgi:hypothetical protein